MTIVSVDVPDVIAKKFVSNKIILSHLLYQELDDYEWESIHVWEKASVVLDYLKSLKK